MLFKPQEKAGRIISGESDTAEAKMKMECMEELGVRIVRNPAHIGKTVQQLMSGV